MGSAVLAALVAALTPAAADRLAAGPVPAGARIAITVSADTAGEAVRPALRLADAGASVTIIIHLPDDVAGAGATEALTLKRVLTELRAAAPGAALGISGSLSRLTPLFTHDLASYVDVVATDSAGQPDGLPRWASARLRSPDGEGRLRTLARADGVDAVLVGLDAAEADDGERVAWLVSTVSRLNQSPSSESVTPFEESVTVVARRRLSAAEIVARHQASAARQRGIVRSLISAGRLRVTFEAPGFSAPVVIEADSELYQSGSLTEIAQRSIRVNGLDFAGNDVPRLPIIEPERVATPPLEIALTSAYRYRLLGVEDIETRPTYIIAFEPKRAGASLNGGKAWIDTDTFGLVRLQAAQTGLKGPIVSSEQIDEYVQDAKESVWLLARSEVRQLYEGAGHRTPIGRVLTVDRHEINPPAFEERRLAAHASDAVMMRDTAAGYVYLTREEPGRGEGIRTASGRATRMYTAVGGVLIDPNISQPLPYAGLNYSDFDLFGTGSQVNAFFGGTYGQAAWSVPSLAGSRWQLSGTASAVLASYHDRAFVDGREIYAANLLQRPAHVDVRAMRQVSPRLAVGLGYDLTYTHFSRADTTAESFQVPASQWAHALRVEARAQRAGWSFVAWWSPAKRVGWKAWGAPAPGAPGAEGAEEDFSKWGGGATRTFLMARTLVGRLEAAWMDGRDLDRFSRYAFGTFESPLKGYPAASVRFDRGVIARSALAWNAARRVRLDAFLDAARVDDGSNGRGYVGIGAAAEVPLPFGMLAAVEWGYGPQGTNTDGSRGTHVVRLTTFKIF
jgi:hypothetical protein